MQKASITRYLSSLLFLIALTTLPQAQAALENLQLEVTDLGNAEIAWAQLGDPEGEPVVMIMGLGASHKIWGDDIVDGLTEAGYRVILFDNRDVGMSQRFDHLGQPVLWWNLLKNQLGFPVSASYTLYDLAQDTIDLMDHLDIDRAHIIGTSMGGMIAQTVASHYPERTKSLVSIMSTSGAPHLPPPQQEDEQLLKTFSNPDEELKQKMEAHGFYPDGMPRQLMAVIDAGDRTNELKKIQASTLVIHGRKDGLVPLAHGEHTAEVIPNASLKIFDDMKHDFPKEVVGTMVEYIANHINAVASTTH